MAVLHLDRMRRLASEALAAGAERRSLARFEWDLAGNCQAPVWREIRARPPGEEGGPFGYDPWHRWSPGRAHTLIMDVRVRCRRCDKCRRMRAWEWSMRAKVETFASARTWFGTLTIEPGWQARFRNLARRTCASHGEDWDALDYRAQFLAHHAEIGPHLTNFVKRLRKNTGAPLRFLMVSEAHKSGDPHYHILVHEQSPDHPVTYRQLRAEWPYGHSKFNLVNTPRQAAYVCKYIGKDASARVRASIRYGRLDRHERSNTIEAPTASRDNMPPQQASTSSD